MADDGKAPDLERSESFGRDFVRKISRHQSSHFYQSIEQIRNFETMEDKCKKVVLDYLSQFDDDNEEDVLNAIFDFVDIPPLNRLATFEVNFANYQTLFEYIEKSISQAQKNESNDKTKKDKNEIANEEISDADLANLQKRIDFKWTIGETQNTMFPLINKNTLHGVYFAESQSQIVQKYQVVGCLRDPNFAKQREDFDAKDKNWDPCMDVYFYLVCYETAQTQFKGSVCFSNFWSNMLIFGIDEDFIREACETGDWEFNASSIIASPKKTSLMGRRMFLQKKASSGPDDQNIDEKQNSNNKNNNNDQTQNKNNNDNLLVSNEESQMEMLRYLYDTCDIVTVENESDNENDNENEDGKNEKKKGTENERKQNELFVICEIKLSANNKDEDSVILLTKDGKKITQSLQSLVTKHSIREQRDVDELKSGILPLSEKQLQFITKTKVFGSGDADKS